MDAGDADAPAYAFPAEMPHLKTLVMQASPHQHSPSISMPGITHRPGYTCIVIIQGRIARSHEGHRAC